MSSYDPLIITASAGTGKTYRLSLEYIALILRYFEHPDFSPDNILVLTFTRKATAEIRERIIKHLKELTASGSDETEVQKAVLVHFLRRSIPDAEHPDELNIREHNALFSVYKAISNNRQLLQVMTIDSYISSIFRNIVRPLRGIDRYELDTQAAEKRVPDILRHLMSPELKHRADKLLRRRIAPSLDEYRKFFTSLIEMRWYHYLFTKRIVPGDQSSLRSLALSLDPDKAEKTRQLFRKDLDVFLAKIDLAANAGDGLYADLFNSGFKAIVGVAPVDRAQLEVALEGLCSNPGKLYKLFDLLNKDTGGNLYNGNKLRKKEHAELKAELAACQQSMTTSLADHLLIELLIPEQNDIMDIWGEILREYDRLVYRYRNLSYDDISWLTFEALYSENSGLRDPEKDQVDNEFYQFLSHRSRFILIDEFQDTSLIQFNILKPIIEEVTSGEGTKEFGGLVVVGDEKQSIFGWRGGERDLLLNLQNIIGPICEVRNEVLDSSWRSSPMIMNFINNSFGHGSIQDYLKQNKMQWDYREIRSEKPELDKGSFLRLKVANYRNRGVGEVAIEDIYQGFIDTMVKPVYYSKDSGNIAIICRKTKELSELQLMLETNGITGVFEPSQPLTEHPMVKPLLYWLRYVAYNDLFALLGLLRSDYLRLKAKPLKRAIQLQIKTRDEGSEDPLEDPLIESLRLLAAEVNGAGPLIACEKLIRAILNLEDKKERELVNLDAFLAVVRDFEFNRATCTGSIPEFLEYLEENQRSEQLRQRATEQSGSLQLLTIHKSKGLQFDTVLVFYNLSSGSGNDYQSLSRYLRYSGDDFSEISDFAVTLHYDKLISRSRFSYLSDQESRREQLEEMNNLYVAFTRAVSRLGIYIAYLGSEAWEEYFTGRSDRSAKKLLPLILTNACVAYMDSYGISEGESTWSIYGDDALHLSEVSEDPQAVETVSSPPVKLSYDQALFAEHSWEKFEKRELSGQDPLLRVKGGNYANLRGDIAHFYLSQIITGKEIERSSARSAVMRRFGSLVPMNEILRICKMADKAISEHQWLFDPKYDLIFTERNIWHEGKQLRIDRMMINSDEREIMIVDFKTGRIHEKEQLESYRQALLDLDWVRRMSYSIEIEYLKISL